MTERASRLDSRVFVSDHAVGRYLVRLGYASILERLTRHDCAAYRVEIIDRIGWGIELPPEIKSLFVKQHRFNPQTATHVARVAGGERAFPDWGRFVYDEGFCFVLEQTTDGAEIVVTALLADDGQKRTVDEWLRSQGLGRIPENENAEEDSSERSGITRRTSAVSAPCEILVGAIGADGRLEPSFSDIAAWAIRAGARTPMGCLWFDPLFAEFRSPILARAATVSANILELPVSSERIAEILATPGTHFFLLRRKHVFPVLGALLDPEIQLKEVEREAPAGLVYTINPNTSGHRKFSSYLLPG